MNPVSVAIEGKGPLNFVRRSATIARRYGVTPDKMDQALAQFAAVLRRFRCSATLPITGIVLERNPHVVRKYQAQGIEFAVHGYRHLDHSQLSQAEQLAHLSLAKQAFAQVGIQVKGFRSPYLRWNSDTLMALGQQGFVYESSQGLDWDVLDGYETPAYHQVLDFYAALSSRDYPSLPSLEGNLVRIPYSLPDDEALVERLALRSPSQMGDLWLNVLHRTHELGELFTVGLHPERIALLAEPLMSVLARARQLVPAVWIARLDEIASWWQARMRVRVDITEIADSQFRLSLVGPDGILDDITVLTRSTAVDVPTVAWTDGYLQVKETTFIVCSRLRPFVGLSPVTSPRLADFLRQQGYIVEISGERCRYSYYFDQAEFSVGQMRPLLAQIEETEHPLVRLGRWPKGARSALAVTGDIDALTLWDYGMRLLDR